MSQYTFKMPDLGEGTVDAEIVAWHTQPGELVAEDQLIVEVMTDKAAVEVPAPVSGRVVSVTGAPGDKVAVGSPLIVFEVGEETAPCATAAPAAAARPAMQQAGDSERRARVLASPATRRRAREAGIDLRTVTGSGPGGRIANGDLKSAAVPQAPVPGGRAEPAADITEIKVIGLRRLIAERMSEAKRTIPHFGYVEEVDVTELESLRLHLNLSVPNGAHSLSVLPFVVMALTRVLEAFPQINVLYDATRGVLLRHRAVHVGIATQTPHGLKVPVMRNAQTLSLWEVGGEIRRLADRARANQATRDELAGSTITVTSLGRLGGIASTPIINAPEVAIIGLNKAVERPVVHGGAVVVRRIINLSSSFDHRFVDGYDAAAMIQALKERLEHPATIFISKVKSP
ncbi:MAG: 2-oxo acid dehydrogenase subunit E2 [Pseudomonadota bacterium]|nr:2-oxo acid dehydrogenase subunit E2 [Pseudomonadota bacterium]